MEAEEGGNTFLMVGTAVEISEVKFDNDFVVFMGGGVDALGARLEEASLVWGAGASCCCFGAGVEAAEGGVFVGGVLCRGDCWDRRT